jgi:uncharacterized protein YcaQ
MRHVIAKVFTVLGMNLQIGLKAESYRNADDIRNYNKWMRTYRRAMRNHLDRVMGTIGLTELRDELYNALRIDAIPIFFRHQTLNWNPEKFEDLEYACVELVLDVAERLRNEPEFYPGEDFDLMCAREQSRTELQKHMIRDLGEIVMDYICV